MRYLFYLLLLGLFPVIASAQVIEIDICPQLPPAGNVGDTVRIPIIVDAVEPDFEACNVYLFYTYDSQDLEVVESIDFEGFSYFDASDNRVSAEYASFGQVDPIQGLAAGDTLCMFTFIQKTVDFSTFYITPPTETIFGQRIRRCESGESFPFSSCGTVYFDGIFSNSVDVCPQILNDVPSINDTTYVLIKGRDFKHIVSFDHDYTFNNEDYEFVFIEEDQYINGMFALNPTDNVGRIVLSQAPIYGLSLEDGADLILIRFLKTTNNPVSLNFNFTPTATLVQNDESNTLDVTYCGQGEPSGSTINFRASIYQDTSNLCQVPNDSTKLLQWFLSLDEVNTGLNYFLGTNNSGIARAQLPVGIYEYSWIPPSSLGSWDVCDNGTLEILPDTVIVLHSTVFSPAPCFDPVVQISSSNLRPCFANNRFFIYYYNQGSANAPGAFIELTFDPAYTPNAFDFPMTEVAPNVYRGLLGDLAVGQSGIIRVVGTLDCDFPVGNTVCAEAIIYPNKGCNFIQPDYEGGEMTVTSECGPDSITFTATNIGDGPTGVVSYEVLSDNVLYEQGEVNLAAGISQSFNYPADGSTWRLSFERPTSAPFFSHALAISEGCNGSGGMSSSGFVTALSLLDFDSFYDRYCLETSAAYDPNDKTATPFGVGPDHYIYPNQSLDYRIRFQNTGTDTAFTVIVRDTIDTNVLDISTFRAGISSHDYDLRIENGNEVIFTYNNIMLPDSFVNEPASNGFVHYQIAQLPNLPDFTQINNRAGIYFDFNEVVLTEYSELTVARDFLPSSTKQYALDGAPISVFPNPVQSALQFNRPDWPGVVQLTVFDALGRVQITRELAQSGLSVDTQNWAAGVYSYLLRQNGVPLQSGVFIKE